MNPTRICARQILLAVIGALSAMGGAVPALAQGTSNIQVTAPADGPVVLPEGHDYFVRQLGEQRDMRELADVRWLDGVLRFDTADGEWRAATYEGARLFAMWPGMAPGAANIGVTGERFPIDADRYRQLSLRVFTPEPVDTTWWGLPGLFSDGGPVVAEGQTEPGWQTIVHHLDDDWTGRQQGLMVDLRQGIADLRIDWIRLTDPDTGPQVNVAWAGASGQRVDIYVDDDLRRKNGLYAKVAEGVANDGAHTISLSAMPPGLYRIYVTPAEEPESGAYAPSPVLIVPSPTIELTSPSMQSGADYATVELDNPWDMETRDDLFTGGVWDWIWGGLHSFPTFENGLLTAVTSNTNPFMLLAVDPLNPIDTDRYRYLSWRWRVDPNLHPNGRLSNENGWVTRFHYFSDWPITEATRNTIDDIIIWDGWETYEMDLALGYLDDEVPGPGSGWSGAKTVLEFDPLEGTRPFGFQIDWFKLTAAPEAFAGSPYTLTWDVTHADRPVTVTLHYDSDQDPENGYAGRIAELPPKPPASSAPETAGIGDWHVYLPRVLARQPISPPTSYTWAVPANLAGDYYIATEISDGLQSTRQYSEVTLTIRP